MDTTLIPSRCTPRRGFSLVELTIATLIMAILMALVLDGMTSTTRYAIASEQQDDIYAESQRAIKSISDDLATSGWEFYDYDLAARERAQRYYPFVLQQAPAGQAASPTDTALVGAGLPAHASWSYLRRSAALVDWRATAGSPALINAMPQVAGVSADFLKNYITAYGASGVNLLNGTGERDYRNSYFARSQELVFIKASFATTWSTKTNNLIPTVGFPKGPTNAWTVDGKHNDLGILRMSEYTLGTKSDQGAAPGSGPDSRDPSGFYWERTGAAFPKVYTAVNLATWLNDSAGVAGAELVRMRWETLTNPGTDSTVFETPTSGPGATIPRLRADALREYMYAVVPAPRGGGRLVRAVKTRNPPAVTTQPADIGSCIGRTSDGTSGMVVDKVLSDHVVRIVFDTAMTSPDGSTVGSLEMNQVRVRLYMAAHSPQNASIAITRTYDAVLSMRTTNAGADNLANLAYLSGGTVRALPR
jgi:prepilin-type N-terminal cleavage/methylation domain-containing protein